ncbi:hypothetical protein WDU94_006401 [Cyamophila willieti]
MANFSKSSDVEEKEQQPQQETTATTPTPEVESELMIKHPLHNKWTLWYFENDKNKGWEENQREITSFSTVEDFWCVFNHIKQASDLRVGCDYSLFKAGIRPMWEDETNKNGGRWLISLDRKQRNSELNAFWLEILLCLIGEAFDDHSEDICGAVVNIRPKGDKIGIWTVDASRSKLDGILSIGRKIKERLGIGSDYQIVYQSHRDTASRTSSTSKNSFTL